MSDNEKAATFIGWKPTPTNRGYRHPLTGKPVATIAEAPDMSLPENYMRALEAVRATGIYYPEILTNRIGWLARFGKELVRDFTIPVIAESHPDLGTALIKALAALYDAEHEECEGRKA